MESNIAALVDEHANRIKAAARTELEAIVAAVKAQGASAPSADSRGEGRRPMHDKVFEKHESLLTVMVSRCVHRVRVSQYHTKSTSFQFLSCNPTMRAISQYTTL